MNKRICKKILKYRMLPELHEEPNGRMSQKVSIPMTYETGRARDLQVRALDYLKSNVLRYTK